MTARCVLPALALAIWSCTAPPPSSAPRETDAGRAAQNKAAMKRWVEEGHNGGRLEIIGEIFAANYRGHSPGSEDVVGVAKLLEFERGFHNDFPDAKITVDQLVAEGDWVATRWTLTGTHKPTGKRANVTGMTMAPFSEGKVVEDWQNMDTFGLLKQLEFPEARK